MIKNVLTLLLLSAFAFMEFVFYIIIFVDACIFLFAVYEWNIILMIQTLMLGTFGMILVKFDDVTITPSKNE